MKRYLVAGLLLWLPILATLVVLRFLVNLFDKILEFLPKGYQPDVLLGIHLPGLGLIFALMLMLFTGFMITHIIGHRMVALWDGLVAKIPLVRTIYHAVQQVTKSMLSASEDSFSNVLLVEYPRRGVWSIAFQTSASFELAKDATGSELMSVFLPTTPNPTSGFLLLIPKADTVKVDMTVDEALRMVISLGVVLPTRKENSHVVSESPAN